MRGKTVASLRLAATETKKISYCSRATGKAFYFQEIAMSTASISIMLLIIQATSRFLTSSALHLMDLSAILSLPCQYLHKSYNMIHLMDVQVHDGCVPPRLTPYLALIDGGFLFMSYQI